MVPSVQPVTNVASARLADRMAGPLAAIERFFERFLERPAARLFQARLEPVQIQRQLERAMESERRLGSRRTYVPSNYLVLLSPTDSLAFESYRDSLAADLAEALHTHARSRHYTLTARPRVVLDASNEVAAGDVVVHAQPVELPRRQRSTSDPAGQLPRAPAASAQPVAPRAGDSAPPAPGTSLYSAPKTNLPNAVLAVRAPGRPVERRPIRSGTVRVGRALDNDIVLADERVSRHHGQFGVRLGTLVYSDLGSTNGSFLNGTGVTEIALGPGDVLQLGSSTLAIEQGD
jgi:hypothetical protein